MNETSHILLTEHPYGVDANKLDYSPWTFWAEASPQQRADQLELQRGLSEARGYVFGENCFISPLASVQNDELTLGDGTYVAAGAYLSGSLSTGRDCTINPYAVVRGQIVLGDAVRIGAHSSILAFNHTMTDPDVEVFRQPVTFKGVTFGDDIWVGSHVVALDGVSVGSRSVLAAGAVVTKDVPAGAVVGGNPARVLRWRVPALAPAAVRDSRADRLQRFGERIRAQGPAVLARYWDDQAGLFMDRPGVAPEIRAQGDAIELADVLLAAAPPQRSVAEQILNLRERQDPATGLIETLQPSDQPEYSLFGISADAAYHVLSAGHALDLLGSSFVHPISTVGEAGADDIIRHLGRQPWSADPWSSGAWIDTVGTAIRWNRAQPGAQRPETLEALLGWLLTNADPQTGMWGRPSAEFGLLRVVNGFYRATRGTFAQFGVPLPYPKRVIDTVLRHVDDPRYFEPAKLTACNVLDVAHPLWLTRHTGYRAADVQAVAGRLLDLAIGNWRDDAGFGFRAPGAVDRDGSTQPGLQGTEMWLAIIWYLSDLLDSAEALPYRPRGVHSPDPAILLGGL